MGGWENDGIEGNVIFIKSLTILGPRSYPRETKSRKTYSGGKRQIKTEKLEEEEVADGIIVGGFGEVVSGMVNWLVYFVIYCADFGPR